MINTNNCCILIGIDTGTHTGIALYDLSARAFGYIETVKIHEAMRMVGDAYEKYGKSVVGIKPVPDELLVKYSSLKLEDVDTNLFRVTDMIEKPKLSEKFTNYSVLGRCVLDSEIFSILEKTPLGAGNELQLTDAMKVLAQSGNMMGIDFSGKRFDMGNKLGILKANVEVALNHKEIGEEFKEYLKDLVKDS